MRLTGKLLVAHWCRHWFRTLLTLGAIITSVSLVIVVVGGQDVAIAKSKQASQLAANALGRFDMIIIAGSPSKVETNRVQPGTRTPLPGMNQAMLNWLRSHKDVQSLLECSEMGIEASPAGEIYRLAAYSPGQLINSSLRGTKAAEPPYEMVMGSWITGAADDEIVIDASHAFRLVPSENADGMPPRMGPPGGPAASQPAPPANTVGTTFQLITKTGRHDVRIRGVIKTPYVGRGFGGRSLAGMYVTPAAYEKLTGNKPEVNYVLADLRDGASAEDFADQMKQAAQDTSQPVYIETVEDIRADAERMGAMGPRGGGDGFFPLMRNASMNLAILAAIFIVFSTLNMGIQERSRQLAMLRAIGMTRWQVVRLIIAEAFLLALVGWLAGVAVGWYLMWQTIAAIPALAGQNVSLHIGLWLGLGAITAFGATFVAAVLPAFIASRRRPLEGMEGSPVLRSNRPPLWTTPVGLLLIAANPIVTMTSLVPNPWRTTVMMPITCLSAIVGFALVMPVIVLICERLFGRLAGLVFGLNHRLLSRQLSAGLWRSVGCATALMVGLGLYVTVQVWGQSMLRPFLITERSPDAVVTIKPDGIPLERLADVRKLDGVQQVVPMILQYPELANLPADVPVGGVFSREVIYTGCDVNALLGETDGIMSVSFVRGNEQEALAMLADGHSCIITDSLYLRAPQQYDIGKTIALDTSDGGATKSVEYVIAGVVEMDGWQLLTKSTQMRRGMERVGAMVFVPEATILAAYPDAKYKTFWFKLAAGKEAKTLELPMIRIVDPSARLLAATSRPTSRPAGRAYGTRPTSTSASQTTSAMAGEDGLPRRPGGGRGGMGRGPGGMGGPGGRGGPGGMGGEASMIDSQYYARVTDTRAMTDSIRTRADGIIQALTYYPLMALGLSALAVVGTMISSVRVRMWEIGVLRSIGLTRGQLLRQILAEGLLIGLLACLMSILFGVLVSWTGIYASTQMWGVSAPFVIPWKNILLGIGAAVALCVAGSVWPALTAAYRQPLSLLQEGRTTE